MEPAPEARPLREPRPARLLLGAHLRRRGAARLRAARGPHLHLGRLHRHRPARALQRARRAARRAQPREDRRRGVPRLPHPRRPDRRVLPGDRGDRAPRRRARARGARAPAAAPPRGHLPAQAGGPRPAAPGRRRSATSSRPRAPRRSRRCPGSRTARASTCATSPTTSPRSPASCTRQNEDLFALTSTYFNANANRLNRTATRLSVAGTFFIVWTLVTGFFGQNFGWLVDHIDGRRATSSSTASAAWSSRASCSAPTSGAAARTGSKASRSGGSASSSVPQIASTSGVDEEVAVVPGSGPGM